MFEEFEEEIENRRMYEEEMENQAYAEYQWDTYCQERYERDQSHWDDFEDKIKDRIGK